MSQREALVAQSPNTKLWCQFCKGCLAASRSVRGAPGSSLSLVFFFWFFLVGLPTSPPWKYANLHIDSIFDPDIHPHPHSLSSISHHKLPPHTLHKNRSEQEPILHLQRHREHTHIHLNNFSSSNRCQALTKQPNHKKDTQPCPRQQEAAAAQAAAPPPPAVRLLQVQ